MRRAMVQSLVLVAVLAIPAVSRATGLLVPSEKQVQPLAMLNHIVNVAIDD